jgi:hypothetical protein
MEKEALELRELQINLEQSRKPARFPTDTDCLSFAKAVYTGLPPREIRDMIYRFLGYNRSIRIGWIRPAVHFCYDENYYGESKDIQPTYWTFDPKYVGEEMAQEMSRMYYKQNHFFVSAGHELPGLLTGGKS